MLYTEHWDEMKKRMMGYWEREAMDRPCAAVYVKNPDYPGFGSGYYYYDVETSDRKHREYFSNHHYFGEAIPCIFTYFGTAGTAEYTGSKANRSPDTTWFEPWMADEDEPDASQITYRHPEIFQQQKDAIAKLVELSKGDYLVTVSDNAGILDALAGVRGTDNLLMDMLTDPEFVEEGVQNLLKIYKKTQEELFEVVKDNNEGSVHSWMNLWAPSRLSQMQCDLSVMISPEMFNRFAMPELEELCDFLDYPVYHLDGQEQIRHLDSLLSIKKLRAIQWTHVAGQPRTSTFIPVLQRIQKAGKNLVLFPDLDEVLPLVDNLSCRGLQMVIRGLKNDEEARDLLKQIENHSRDRKF